MFSLTKAANEASSTLVDLVNVLAATGVLDAATASEIAQQAASSVSTPVANAALRFATGQDDGEISYEAFKRRDRAKKPRKRETDPNAPKRPLNAYLTFSNEQKKQIREDRESQKLEPLSMSELNKLVQERWTNLGQEEREKYHLQHTESLQQFNEELKRYKIQKLEGSLNVGKTEPKEVEPSSEDEPVEEVVAKTEIVERHNDEDKKHDDEETPKKTKKSKRKKEDGSPDKKRRKKNKTEEPAASQ